MKVRLVSTPPSRGSWNMAVDEALLASCASGESCPVLRFYQWDPPCLSLGFFQDANKEVDFEGLKETGTDLVRRATGGKAVLHDNELTYSVIIRQEDLPGSVLDTYRELSNALVEGLRTLGLSAKVAALEHGVTSRDARFRQAACFTAPSWYEVTVGDAKVIGSAQHRKDGVILQHGSIPFAFDASKLVRCLKTSSAAAAERLVSMLKAKASGIWELLNEEVPRDVVEDHMIRGFEDVLCWQLEPGGLTEKEIQCASRLEREKYGDGVFTLNRGQRREK